ncbi:MAG TPA: methyl-accepting chemotaxis protein [Thermoanaerobaculia bacterium]|nr:methyl-accepting chemotaxis protein [Thermoanaerobaculia bacterium]
MSLSNRYLRNLLVVPAIVCGPMAIGFLALVIRMSARDLLSVTALALSLYLAAALLLRAWLSPALTELERGLETEADLSVPMSRLLRRVVRSTWILWLVGGALFTIIGSLVVFPTPLGFSYFFVAAIIAGSLGVSWGYAAGKEALQRIAARRPARYVGRRRFTVSKKIALVFIGLFIVSAVALIQLVSSKVSTTLENLAIKTAAERFERLHDSANLSAKIDGTLVSTLEDYIPGDYGLHRITSQGTVTSHGEPLTPREVSAMLRLRSGDSSSFVSPHVSRFRPLKDGSILVLTIPWAPYRNIPVQITFYTLIVAIVTTLLFALAAFLVGRDVTRGVDKLRTLSSEMARGNFDADSRVFADDEIGDLEESFGQTRENLRRLLARVGGGGASITDGVRVISGGTESLLERSREQLALTDESTAALQNVRIGIGAVLEAAETVSELTEDSSSRSIELQASAEEVARSMDELFQSVEKTSSSTTQMSAAATGMAQRTEVLASITEEVLSFVTQMDSTNDELRQSAESTAQISRQVRENAVAGGQAVNETVEGIELSQRLSERAADVLDTLQKSVGQITQILSVIEDVTERTNLLALNAAIIAAQAGEHGLGFSVVADEIRELAVKTRGSTKEIAGIIKAVQSGSRDAAIAMHEGVAKVQENAAVAQNAAGSLRQIVESAARSYEMANRISKSLVDQSQASRHLNGLTVKMSDHIAENNRAIQEQARATQLLASEAERVREVALQVKTSTQHQLTAGRGIASAMEQIAEDTRSIRQLLESQIRNTDQIASASQMMGDIARQNDSVAQDFNGTVNQLIESGRDFESEVRKFRYSGS